VAKATIDFAFLKAKSMLLRFVKYKQSWEALLRAGCILESRMHLDGIAAQ
jgi:hypothetical protein